MLRVDEQEGSRAWCRERERERGGEKRRGLTEPKPGWGGKGQGGTETQAAKQTAPSVCQEDICVTGLCVTVSDGRSSQGHDGQDRTRQNKDGRGQDRSGQQVRAWGFTPHHNNRKIGTLNVYQLFTIVSDTLIDYIFTCLYCHIKAFNKLLNRHRKISSA